ncbi:hypothetical protein [Parenemella sanctibonifatiensis]|uniref:Tetratricopeptide repeat protein n=1 Tax=Parenemella sanctibonifatiensis TaxID=2016505 RepID=A0A255EM56_9ACTN|nr:hypothetical protein [Parenemella sanctibonifatiensis]OYN92596.1 hypothetical protein CGZ91_03725 [Parenemella sanctibonifatiensis]
MSTDPSKPNRPTRLTPELRSRQQRRRVLPFVIPIVVLLAIFAFKTIGMSVTNQQGREAYEQQDHGSASRKFEQLEQGNVFQPWIAHFNHGTALAKQSQWEPAAESLGQALEQAPKEQACLVANNLAWTWELHGDELAGQLDETGSRQRWQQALDLLQQHRCEVPEQETDRTDTIARLEEKLSQATPEPSSDSTPSGTPTQSPTSNDGDKGDKERQLEEKNRQGEQRQAERRDWDSRETGQPRVERPW